MKTADFEKQIHVWEKQFGYAAFWAAVVVSALILLLFNLYLNCRLAKRTGYSSLWGLFLSMPWISEIGMIWLAFWRWPKQRG